MSKQPKAKNQSVFISRKNQTVNSREVNRFLVEKDWTFINTRTLKRKYKLQKAYQTVRNLDDRLVTDVPAQTFLQYADRFADLLTLYPDVNTPERPVFPENERYLNIRTRRLYPNGEVLVLVNGTLYPQVSGRIDTYVMDLARDGYWATIHVINSGTPSLIRNYIRDQRPMGAVLVGAIAAPWFEMENDFHGSSTSFPCDLYYMDTNGLWNDTDANGKFNDHNGDLYPEIWIGRIWSPTEDGNDAILINDYFDRNHQFRIGQLGHARSALAYVDDDWQSFNDCGFSLMFPSSQVTTYTDPVQTDADLYKAEVNSLRSWVQLCAHSSVYSHSLRSGTSSETISRDYFRDVNPPNAHFYNLFCCKPGRFTQADYLGGWYIFDKPGGSKCMGMSAIASAKTGSMLLFEDFYGPMGDGKVIGDAFVDWWKDRGPDHDLGERRWYYGLVLLGDPTLNWWKGVVPQPLQPEDGAVFDHWPRKIQFRWDQVNVSPVRYHVQVDYYTGSWAEETGRAVYNYYNISGNVLNHTFVGAQPGRWRVRALIGGQYCSWSPWSYFRFTI